MEKRLENLVSRVLIRRSIHHDLEPPSRMLDESSRTRISAHSFLRQCLKSDSNPCCSVAVGMVACARGPAARPFSDLPAGGHVYSLPGSRPDLVFQFTGPAANTDGRKPANLDRVELYVHTARQRVPSEYLRQGRLAGSVKVRRPPPPDEEVKTPAPADSGVEQGSPATINAMPDFFVPPVLRRPVAAAADTSLAPLFADGGGPLLSPRSPTSETRLFIVAGVNRRGRFGPPSPALEVPIVTAPAAPDEVQVTYSEQAFVLAWMPPPLARRRPIQEPAPRGGALASRPLAGRSQSSRLQRVHWPARLTARQPPREDPSRPSQSHALTETSLKIH